MYKVRILVVFCSLLFGFQVVYGQDLRTNINANKKAQDSIRNSMEGGKDSVVFNAKFIRYTTLKLTKDSIQTLPIDTGLTGFHNFSVLAQPRRPMVGTGNLGLAAVSMLFEPLKTIGFDAGFHALDAYALNHDDVKFYKARTAFSSLYYVSGGQKEQVLKLIHTQNIKKNWNFGANYDRIGANGSYFHQRGDHLNGAVFSWYESPNKRYNLWVDGIFNTLKAQENGSVINEKIFVKGQGQLVNKYAEAVRLNTAKQLWRKNSFQIRQTYFVGRIDSTGKNSTQNILPTNKISYTFSYTNEAYSFKKNEADTSKLFPETALNDMSFTNDSTSVKHIKNEFIYSFFLRAKGNAIIKNELKIDAGIRHDFYNYAQYGLSLDHSKWYTAKNTFQNLTLLGVAGYRFSNRVNLNVDIQQIFQGRNIGDFLYEAKSNVLLSNKAGRIVLGAYLQNKSPEELYRKYHGNHYQWEVNGFDRTKTANLSFNYINDQLKFDAAASYYLINNLMYFRAGSSPQTVEPAQESSAINLLQISLGKRFEWNSFHLDSYVVYQKTDRESLIRTPEVYTFNSVYKEQTFFKVLKTQIGFDLRYNTSYKALSYAPAISQFYNGKDVVYDSKPVVDVWVKAGLRRANLFVKYDYVNQGLLSNGYYTVIDYPMPDRLLKFGLIWNFYD